MKRREREHLPHAVVEVTPVCNLRCRHCYNPWKRGMGEGRADAEGKEGRAERDEWLERAMRTGKGTYRKAARLLDWLVERTTAERVVFTGGEPTLSERFLELVVHAKVKGLRVTVITNGNGDLAVYEGLARAGVDLMEFSVLSARAETHDGITGVKGSWERAMRSLRLMMKRGVEVVPVTVVMERNAGEVAECVEYLHGMGLRRFMVNRYNIGGEGLNQAEEVSASQERLRETFREVDGLAGRLGLEVVSGVCTPHCLLDPKDYPHIRFGNCPTDVYRRPLTFDLEGNVRMCNHSPRVAGNVYRQELADILFSDYACSWTETRAAFCEDCAKWEACRGGCRAASEQTGGTLRDVDPAVGFAMNEE